MCFPFLGDGDKPAVTKAAAEDEAAILDSGEKAKKSSKIKPGETLFPGAFHLNWCARRFVFRDIHFLEMYFYECLFL